MTTTTITVKGMTCGGCVNSVTRALSAVPGVEKTDVQLEQATATVTFDEHKTNEAALKEAVEEAGYETH